MLSGPVVGWRACHFVVIVKPAFQPVYRFFFAWYHNYVKRLKQWYHAQGGSLPRAGTVCHGAGLLLDKGNIRQIHQTLVDGSNGEPGSLVSEMQLLLTQCTGSVHWIPP